VKKIVLFIAQEGFRDEEYFHTKEVLEKNNFVVITASENKGNAIGKLGASAISDISIYDLKSSDFDALFLIGGPGSYNYFEDQKIHKLLKETYESGKFIGAICAAPAILAHAGLLKGKKATSYDGVSSILIEKGAIYTGNNVEVDGQIITADGPSSAKSFGLKIAELIKKSDEQ